MKMSFLDIAAILDALRTATGSFTRIEKDEHRVEPELELPTSIPREYDLVKDDTIARGGSGEMVALVEAFPSLVKELSQVLRNAGSELLAEQVEQAVIERVTFSEAANAGYIYVRPSRDLNIVETNIIGVRHGETIEVETQYWTNIDTDNFGRLVGIEVLAPGGIKNGLIELADG